MLMKESEGHIIGETLLYESMSITYRLSPRGKEKRYIPDFFDTRDMRVYEVKPRKRSLNRVNRAKAEYATKELAKNGIEYILVDERSIPKLTRAMASKIEGVSLSKRRKKKR